MRFRAIFEVTHDDGSKLPSCTQDFECESWYEVLDIISEKISNPPYEVFYHMDLRVLKVIERRDKVNKMKTETFIKLNDLCTGDMNRTSSMICPGVDGCPKNGIKECLFPSMPLTCITDMVRYACKLRCPFCEVPIDNVMDALKGY